MALCLSLSHHEKRAPLIMSCLLALGLAVFPALPDSARAQTTPGDPQQQATPREKLTVLEQVDEVGKSLEMVEKAHKIIGWELGERIDPAFKRELADEHRTLTAMVKSNALIRKQAAAAQAIADGKTKKAKSAEIEKKVSAIDKKLQELQSALLAKAEMRRSLKEHLAAFVAKLPSVYRLKVYLRIQKELDPANVDSIIARQRTIIATVKEELNALQRK